MLLANEPLISEFMAINNVLADENSQFPGWLELHNPDTTTVDLTGYYLTDDSGQLNKWQLPTVSLGAGDYLVVFASGKDRAVAGAELHTNFVMDPVGEYLALVEPNGSTITWEYSPEFPSQFNSFSYGAAGASTNQTLLGTGSSARVLVPTQASELDPSWAERTFDDQVVGWFDRTNGIGFDATGTSSVGPLIDTNGDIQAQMLNHNSSAYERITFEINDTAAVTGLDFVIDFDDGYAAFLNGTEIARTNALGGTLSFDATATFDFSATSLPVTSELVLWLDAQDVNADGGITNPANGGTVSSWTDKSSSGNVLTDVGETLPEYVVGVQNGRSAVRFSGLDALADLTPAGLPTGDSGRSVFFVGTPTANSQPSNINSYLQWGDKAAASQWNSYFVFDLPANDQYYNYAAGHINDFFSPTNNHDLTGGGPWDGRIIEFEYDSPNGTFWNDGVLDHTGSKNNVAPWSTVLGELRVGKEPNGGSDWDMFEILVYDRVLNDTERNDVGSYLAERYGISSSYTGGGGGGGGGIGHDQLDLTSQANLLVAGTNVLAVQGLNFQTGNSDFLVRPQLAATLTTIDTGQLGFLAPTPGAANGPTFSGLPFISEFMTFNDTVLVDEDGETPDWVEITNTTNTAFDLDGWYLTDNANNLTKWQFPAVTMQPHERLIVFASQKDRIHPSSELHTNFNLDGDGEYLALVFPDGQTVVSEFAPQFPSQFSDVSFGRVDDPSSSNTATWYITNPTPGAANVAVSKDLGPFVTNLSHTPTVPNDLDDIVVTATVSENFKAVSTVTLHYRVNYQSLLTTTMFDDGLHGDGAADDGVWGATIPNNISAPGDMVRFYVTANDSANNTSRWPIFENSSFTPEYFGTVISDSATTSALPIYQWFTANPSAAETATGTRASMFYLDQFYDNIFVRRRGSAGRGNRGLPGLKFDFNHGFDFQYDVNQSRVTEININSPYWDKSYIREILAYQTFRDASSAGSLSFPVRMEQNGQFFAVGSFVEQVDEEFLERNGFDPDGALYKSVRSNLSSTVDLEKRTREYEDFSDVLALIAGINPATQDRSQYLFDNVNVPQVINWIAAGVVMNDYDRQIHNFYVYRDSNGNREWSVFPWDKDLTFGTSFSAGAQPQDYLWTDDDVWAPSGGGAPSHPLNGDSKHRWLGTSDFEYNRLIDAMLDSPTVKEMFLRRLRTLMDELLQPSGTPLVDRKFEQQLDELFDQMDADVTLDLAKYGTTYGTVMTFQAILEDMKTNYFDRRRVHLFNTHNVNNLTTPDLAGIPHQQIGNPTINFGAPNLDASEEPGEIVFNPISGIQDEEYISLINPNSEAVDISGWRLTGGVEHTFQPGVVIPAGGTLYVSPDVVAFRARTTGPGANQTLFVQGNYNGHISNLGETIDLIAADHSIVATVAVPPVPSDVQEFLRISEVHYNPAGSDDTAFIELVNISSGLSATTLDIGGVTLSDGPSVPFSIPGGTQLAAGDHFLIVKNPTAFQVVYPNVSTGQFTGPFLGNLSNAGESLKLDDAQGSTVVEFAYDDNHPWPNAADGSGASLELIDPTGTPVDDFDNPERWRASTPIGGTPGTVSAVTLGVVINEVLTNSEAPNVDAIELHNATAGSVDITGWWLSDSDAKFDKFVIPSTVIPAGGYVVFDENDFNTSGNLTLDFALDGANGDQVWLVKPTVSGTAAEAIADHLDLGPSLTDESFGRWPNGSGRHYPMETPTLGSVNSSPRVGPMVISEIHYHPSNGMGSGQPTMLEFLEIYNPTAQAVDVTDWRIDGLGYTFPAVTTIGPAEIVVIVPFDPVMDSAEIANFEATYGVDMAGGPIRYLGPYTGSAADGGEQLTLSRADHPPLGQPLLIPLVVEDRVLYDDRTPWPLTADGGGHSLHRLVSDGWADEVSAWQSGLPSPGALGPALMWTSVAADSEAGEVGTLLGVTHVPQVVSLSRTYANPVVFVQSVSFQGTDTVVARITNVQADEFTIYLAEPSDLNGMHGVGETISYVVMEAGRYLLPDGTNLEVGSVSTSATTGTLVVSPQWQTVTFTSPFAAPPVVLSQIQTDDGLAYLQTRHNNLSTSNVDLALEQEEQLTTQHGMETIGYLAMDPGIGIWNELLYEAQTTGTSITDNFSTINLLQTYAGTPAFLTSLASFQETDNAHLRYQNLGQSSVQLKVEEDTTIDTETAHTAEQASLLAIGGQGLLTVDSHAIGQGSPREFSLVVGDSGQVLDVNVMLDIQHSRTSDLEVFLEAPDGTTVDLFRGVGGASTNFSGTVIDDEAGQLMATGSGPFTGVYQPEGSLADLRGKNIAGIWKLIVEDTVSNADNGTLHSWSLSITPAPSLSGNVNHDSQVNALDIDLVYAQIGSTQAAFDLNTDGTVDQNDVDELVLNLLNTQYGDADLDRDIDIADFNALATSFDPLGQAAFAGWAAGNFDGDADIDIRDFSTLVRNFSPLGLQLNLLSTVQGDVAAEDDRTLPTVLVDEVDSQSLSNVAPGQSGQSIPSSDTESHPEHPPLVSSTPDWAFALLGKDESFRYRRGRDLRFDS